jgi:hypothetical protein
MNPDRIGRGAAGRFMSVIGTKHTFLEDPRVGPVTYHTVDEALSEGKFNAFAALNLKTNPRSKHTRDGCRGLVASAGLVMKVIFSQSGCDRDHRAPRGTQRNRMGCR